MKFAVVIASLLGVFLAPALANKNTENGPHSENSNHSDTGVSIDPKEGSEGWKTVWDFENGYVATKVFSKNTCIIASTSRRLWLGKQFSTPPQGDTGPGAQPLPPRENRFIISMNRLPSLSPYGKRIQALCRGIPSYLAYPAPGSNFLRGSNFSRGSNISRGSNFSRSNFLERHVS